MLKKGLPILFITILIASCYTFKGVSIDYTKVSTFSLGSFPNNSTNVVPTLSQDFKEALRLKILSESRLGSTTANADIEFNGSITGYQITAVAPQAGETTQFNRLTITVQIDFVNNTDPEENWSQSFSWLADYDATKNLPDVQDALHDEIITQLTENIFNKAFTNW